MRWRDPNLGILIHAFARLLHVPRGDILVQQRPVFRQLLLNPIHSTKHNNNNNNNNNRGYQCAIFICYGQSNLPLGDLVVLEIQHLDVDAHAVFA